MTVSNIELLNKLEKVKSQTGSSRVRREGWQDEFCRDLDAMVMSFLDFPDSVPQDYRDKQFARHLLWRIGDKRLYFKKLFLGGNEVSGMKEMWGRLLPYITGDMPENISALDPKAIWLNIKLRDIVYDLTVVHRTDFDGLMAQVVEMVRAIRKI